jgi:hypothetical protein
VRASLITEAVNLSNGEYYYGDLHQRRGRIIFSYDDMNKPVWDADGGCQVPATVRKVYGDLLEFSREWRITQQLPYPD